ncbi:MAG: hypothetical protein K6F51_14370 [Acetatifactor sp.]|nr:hypothetical protein [Acetatifactor sp.]
MKQISEKMLFKRNKKKFICMLALLMTMVMVAGTSVYAAVCPACEAGGIHAECLVYETHLWDATTGHWAEYNIGVVHHKEWCTYHISENRIDWVCPNGHGTVSSAIHHYESHSCIYCGSNEYYY